MRRCVINEVSNQLRKANRRPSTGLTDDIVSSEPGPDKQYEGTRIEECYELALSKMSDEDQQIIIEKVEMGFSYTEIAAMHHIQVNAARMRVARALVRLAEVMKKLGHRT
jgi:RNA polymerase sigma factor (sigma-70 family)